MNILQDLDECLSVIEVSLADSQGGAEYALYIKALIHRQKGAQLAVLFRRALVYQRKALKLCEML